MRFIETSNGSGAMWMPNARNPRYMYIAGVSMAPVFLLLVEWLREIQNMTLAICVVLLAICAAIPPLSIARSNGLFVTRDFVLKGSFRKPSRKIRRTDVAEVRYRGEYGELLGHDGAVLLKVSSLLTRQQMTEIADYLHVRCSGDTAGLAPEVFVLRPNRIQAIKYKLVFGLLAVLDLGLGGFEVHKRAWGSLAYLTGMFVVVAAIGVTRFRSNTLVVTGDAVYKGRRSRKRFAARAEIAEVVYGPRFTLNAADGKTLLAVDASLFADSQAQELAQRLDTPIRRVAKASSKSRQPKQG